MGLFFILLEFRYFSFRVGKYGFATGLTTVSVFAVAATVEKDNIMFRKRIL